MQSKEYIKNQARKLAKQTWAGPGKFGVLIILSIIVIATFESLGLSNREKNLEFRNVQNIVMPIDFSEKNIVEGQDLVESKLNSLNEKIKISTQIDINNKIFEREKILLNGAMEQNIFENNFIIKNFEKLSTEEKIIFFYTQISQNSNKLKNIFFFDT